MDKMNNQSFGLRGNVIYDKELTQDIYDFMRMGVLPEDEWKLNFLEEWEERDGGEWLAGGMQLLLDEICDPYDENGEHSWPEASLLAYATDHIDFKAMAQAWLDDREQVYQ